MEYAFSHPFDSVLVRLAFSLLAGLILGFEREARGRIAGLKTIVLVTLASSASMIVSTSFLEDAHASWRYDPGRISAGVLNGMGFLGAGVIIRQGRSVQGVTTAAVLWLSAIVGLVMGSGYLVLGAAVVALAMGVLMVVPRLEQFILNESFAVLVVRTENEKASLERICQRLEEEHLAAEVHRVDYDASSHAWTYQLMLKYKTTDRFFSERVVARLSELGAAHISWQ